MNDIALNGCTVEPLISYLDGLGALRILNGRGYWKNGVFHILTDLDKEGLIKFFLNDYEPTPVVSPWNGGSGFNEGDKLEKDVNAIRGSTDPRFEQYREVIKEVKQFPEFKPATVREMVKALQEELSKTKDDDLKELLEDYDKHKSKFSPFLDGAYGKAKGSNLLDKRSRAVLKKINTNYLKLVRGKSKEAIVDRCRAMLPDSALEWIDAALLIDNTDNLKFPPMLGSGGNDGNLDFSGQFMRYTLELLTGDKKRSEELLRNALFGEPTVERVEGHIGMYDPGNAGGSNQGMGVEDKDVPINPWKFVLAIEGLMIMPSSIARRTDVNIPEQSRGILSSPFTVNGVSAGSQVLDSAERIKAESWMPLWDRPASYREIRMLFAEGRADTEGKHASSTIEFAEAAASFGIDRGLTGFIRYCFVQRRGKSLIAVPVGSFDVHEALDIDLMRNLRHIMSRPERVLSKRNSNETTRRVHDLMLKILRQSQASSEDYTALVRQIGVVEKKIVTQWNKGEIKGPITGLGKKFLLKLNVEKIEVRLALALASIAGMGEVGYIRSNIEPVDPLEQFSWYGNSLPNRLISVIRRRLLDASKAAPRANSNLVNPFHGLIMAYPEDVMEFIYGRVDESLLEELLFGLMWINWNELRGNDKTIKDVNGLIFKHVTSKSKIITYEYSLLKLLFLPYPINYNNQEIKVKSEISIIDLLQSNHISRACGLARRRLLNEGIPVKQVGIYGGNNGPRLAASLIFPINDYKPLLHSLL